MDEKRVALQNQDKEMDTILLVAYPNVGKSVVFNALTGSYVVVSNYPGTTVAVDRGKAEIPEKKMEIIDIPSMYSLLPLTEEKRVARRFPDIFCLPIHHQNFKTQALICKCVVDEISIW